MTEPTTRSIVVERVMPHPPEKIWRALTEGPLIEQWLMKNDFQPVVGHRFNFRAKPMPDWNGVTDCEVLAVEPHQAALLSLVLLGRGGGGRTEDRRHLDADADQGRHARAHGALGLPAGRRGLLPGRRLRLAEVGRGLEQVAAGLDNGV